VNTRFSCRRCTVVFGNSIRQPRGEHMITILIVLAVLVLLGAISGVAA
jgi:hypothetical protein